MLYEIYYGTGTDGIPVKDRRLYKLLDHMGDEIVDLAREWIAEGHPERYSEQKFRGEVSGLTFTTYSMVIDPDLVEAGQQPILVLMSEESYRTFLKLCELMGWDEDEI